MVRVFLALLFSIVGCSAPVILSELEPGNHEQCYEQKLPVAYQICLYDEKSQNRDIVYYLHGTGDWVHGFSHRTKTDGSFEKRQQWLREMRKRGGVPRIISVSFGRSFLLNNERLQIFSQIQKDIEPRLGAFRHRYLMGFSMGGHNALRAMQDQPDRYSKVVILSPNLPHCYPFLSKDALFVCNFRSPHLKDIPEMDSGLGLATDFQIKDSYSKEEYDRDNPLAQLVRFHGKLPPIYLSVGTRDQFGFFRGTRQLHARLRPVASSLRYREIDGGRHNEFDAAEIADFLQK